MDGASYGRLIGSAFRAVLFLGVIFGLILGLLLTYVLPWICRHIHVSLR